MALSSFRENPSRARHQRYHRLRVILRCAAAALFLWPYTFSISNASGTFTLLNSTGYYLDARVNEMTALFLPPGSSYLYKFDAPASINVDVSYSPAQGVKGSACRMFYAELQSSWSGTSNTHNDCSSGGSSKGNDCSTNSTESSQGNYSEWTTPIQWVVRPDTLTVKGE